MVFRRAGFQYNPGPKVLPGGVATITANKGNYAGDDTANRAIAHGLGVKPRLVRIALNNEGRVLTILSGRDYVNYSGAPAAYAVTAMDTTNFYVGNATSYINSGNGNGVTYYWAAVK